MKHLVMQLFPLPNICDVSIPNLRDDNVNLLAKIEGLNVSLAGLRNEMKT